VKDAGKSGLLVRTMQPEEMNLAIEWAAAEGWNPGLYDGPVFYATDPAGFFIGLLDGEPIGCISTVAYDRHFGFLGFYIVKPAFRGMGFGLQLWVRGMEHLTDRNVGLDGVPAQIDNYRRSGFELAYRNVRYEGVARTSIEQKGQQIRELTPADLDEVATLDREVFPASRDEFLKAWLALPEGYALGVDDDGVLTGYGVIRGCRIGYKVGPLIAGSETAASGLFQALTSRVEVGAPIFLDVPAVNPPAIALAEANGMTPVFETARMYNRGAPAIRLDKIYGVTTFELG
jgi:GNAT superfamily N-acetyltransferase